MAEKERLDSLLVERGLATSRELAKAYIMAGHVYVDGKKEEKAGTKLPAEAVLEVRAEPPKYVSRGGQKLEKAVAAFSLSLAGYICMDVGASTGGFTDCMLQNGAEKVYAIDVGYGQLDWKLRSDPRVVCLERTNVRYITEKEIPVPADFASIDVSFISLTKVLPAVCAVLAPKGEIVALVKPQFEAGKGRVGKKGVVREPEIHHEVLDAVLDFAFANGFVVRGISFSPIRGPQGNIEYLLYLAKQGEGLSQEEAHALAAQTVALSHEAL